MKYEKTIILKDGRTCLLRSGVESDGKAVLENFNLVHAETDNMLSYSDENSFNEEQETEFLKAKSESDNEAEILAVVDGTVAGTAGIEAIGSKYKVKHRASFGIGIAKEYWGLGIGRGLINACIECAKEAGYKQLELEAVAGNENALALYKSAGFVEYGRNPKGFNSRYDGWQELVLMLLEL